MQCLVYKPAAHPYNVLMINLLQVFVAITNIGGGQSLSRSITYHPYSDGTSKYGGMLYILYFS